MVFKLLLLLGSTFAFGQQNLRTQDFQQSLNAHAPRNYMVNSGYEKDEEGLTDASNIAERIVGSALEGRAGLNINATGSAQIVFSLFTSIQENILGGMCEASFSYVGDASLYKAYVSDGANNLSAEVQLTNSGLYSQEVSLNFPCIGGDLGGFIAIESTGDGASINVDSFYVGKALNIGSAAQSEVVLSATRITSNQTIATTDATQIVFNSKNVDPLSEYSTSTGTFTAKRAGRLLVSSSAQYGAFTAETGVDLLIYKNGAAVCRGFFTGLSTTSGFTAVNNCVVDVAANDTVAVYSDSASDASYDIVLGTATWFQITRIPTASEQVFRVGAPGLDWTAYTPTVTHDSGGITNATTTGFYKCSGSNLEGVITTTFSNTSAAYSGLFYSLPSGFTANIATALQTPVGQTILRDTGVAAYFAPVRINSSTTVRVDVANIATHSGTVPVLVTTSTNSFPFTFNNADTINVYYSVPVTASSPCPRAPMPLLKNAVTTSSQGVEKVNRARLTCGASSSINWQSGTWISSIGNVSSGTCAVTIATGVFPNAQYACSFIREGSNAANLNTVEISGKSATGFNMLQINQAAGTTAADAGPVEWDVICMGAN